MTTFFAVHKDGQVVRTGRVPAHAVELQAINEGETVVVMNANYKPDRLYFDGVVKRLSDNTSVEV
jgi:hypothetical protein